MSRKKKTVITLSVLWVLFVLLLSLFSVFIKPVSKFTAKSDALRFSGNTYICDNSYGFGEIYKISNSGSVDKIYVTHRRNYVSDWEVVKLAASSSDTQTGGDIYAVLKGKESSDGYVPYRLLSFTEDLSTDAMTVKLYLKNNLLVTDLSYDDGVLYITGISSSRQDIYVYSYNEYEMITIDGISQDERAELSSGSIELDEISSERSGNGNFYSTAEYDEDYETAKSLFDNRTESFFLRLKETGASVVFMIAYSVIGCILVVLISHFISHRRWIFYRIILTECLIAVSCIAVFFISVFISRQNAINNYYRSETYSLLFLGAAVPEDAGSGDLSEADYDTFYQNMKNIKESNDQLYETEDVLLSDSGTGDIIISLNGFDNIPIYFAYGDMAGDLATSQNRTGRGFLKTGRDNFLYTAAQSSKDPGLKLLSVARFPSFFSYVMSDCLGLLIITVLLFIFISTASIAIISFDSTQFKKIGLAIEALGMGDIIEEDFDAVGTDVKWMWAGINEASKLLKRADHDKFMTYEAYFRFTPKRIEKILGKEAITEVRTGDTKRIKGTIAIIMTNTPPINGQSSVNEKNAFFNMTEGICDETNGIFISAGTNLAAMRVLFTEDNKNSIRFGTDLSREAYSDNNITNPTIILHYGSFLYGVSGTDKLCYTFLTTENSNKLEKYVWQLGRLGVSMVITEPVKEREGAQWDLRYIGFVLPEEDNWDNRLNLYEVLDAVSSDERRGKKRTMAEFEKALKLFYERDFYFARTAFSDILREVPYDSITKWYLFECERLLNSAETDNFSGELHIDKEMK